LFRATSIKQSICEGRSIMRKVFLAVFFVFWASHSYAENPTTMYRASMEDPDTVKASGGFLARGMDESRPNQPPPNSSLYDHANGGSTGMARYDSAYVSTTSVHRFAVMRINEYFNYRGYIYHVHPTPNFVDVNASLRHFSPYPQESEFAALGTVHWRQIIGWQRVRNGHAEAFVPNRDYNSHLLQHARAAGAMPELAGFPEAHQAWRVEPWVAFAQCGRMGLSAMASPPHCAADEETPQHVVNKLLRSTYLGVLAQMVVLFNP